MPDANCDLVVHDRVHQRNLNLRIPLRLNVLNSWRGKYASEGASRDKRCNFFAALAVRYSVALINDNTQLVLLVDHLRYIYRHDVLGFLDRFHFLHNILLIFVTGRVLRIRIKVLVRRVHRWLLTRTNDERSNQQVSLALQDIAVLWVEQSDPALVVLVICVAV